MTVREMSEKLNLKIICMPQGDRTVGGGYAGDLLSWVMGRAASDDAWITIMSNMNIIAVASLVSPSCIVLAEGVQIDEDVKGRAEMQGVNILSSELDTFALCSEISNLI